MSITTEKVGYRGSMEGLWGDQKGLEKSWVSLRASWESLRWSLGQRYDVATMKLVDQSVGRPSGKAYHNPVTVTYARQD